ncbi:tetratricopeptide repeat protein [Mucilaginibacter sp. PAMB04168]|uniref:type IX secretion system periplasmic lipoprotein PorW/SprE n=1 Tax=Mucilaginibacter sp. PAMB04168 TaxID=3138567 RepID=UPI0031F6857D
MPLTVTALLMLVVGCSLEKESAVNRGLQNLTARYNILFNANELLRQKQETYATTFVDDYDQLLNVYQDTASHLATGDKDLEAVVAKANAIISIKEQSHYIGDAYLLLGKAAHLNADYFNAVEYFGYVIRSFANKPDLVQEARAWQIRSYVYLDQLGLAKNVLDTALLNATPKTKTQTGYIYAAGLQYYTAAQNYPEAINMAQKAIELSKQNQLRLRWTFILAQLQELTRQPADAYTNYTRVVKSNAPFIMAFNAELNRIRIEDTQNGRHLSRADRLKSLLRNENNEEFTDQIYYQLGELALTDNKTDEAIKNYNQSIKSSLKNQTQKGLSYLRLADISFKTNGDYAKAKQYYDSTLLNLSPNYPGYQTIRKKADNLQLLADRLQTIAREDTLQALAKLDEPARAQRIAELTRVQGQQLAANNTNANSPYTTTNAQPMLDDNTAVQGPPSNAGSGFYFNNVNAVSQGFTDFKRKWGNRKLEDNWRRSVRYNSDITTNTLNTTQNVDPAVLPGLTQKSTADVVTTNYRQQLEQNIPLTPALMAQSNLRIYNAYLDLAVFYRDVLNDKPEAIAIYEQLVKRFPKDENLAASYYNLYRLYADVDKAKSDEYKNMLIAQFPQSTYAKVITDPDYARRMNDQDAELSYFYNKLYDEYAARQYPQVIIHADDLLKQNPDNKFAAQIAYLRAIASGHQEKVTPFQSELLQIVNKYANDELITPLVRQHLAYIDANMTEMAARKFAIIDSDPNAASFIPAPVVQQPLAAATRSQPAVKEPTQPAVAKPVEKAAVTEPVVKQPSVNAAATPRIPPPAAPSIFNNRDSTNYYFAINVNSGTTNLASSRFGVGQFNRTSYQGSAIKHQLKPVGTDNQLIYVGRFNNLEDAKAYARKIVPLMPQIMKVPADKYSFFIITQENLDKLADRKLLDSYVEYYQKNF